MIAACISVLLFLAQASAETCEDMTRDCLNPQALKAICANDKISYFCKKSCNLCPHTVAVDGGWSLWSNWTACSVTCGPGTWHRNRTCNNPSPSNGGKNCTGSENFVDACKIHDCPAVDGGWSLWSNWTACSVTCGPGTWHRNRTCNNPSPSNGGKNCTGSENFVDACKIQDCPAVDGGWSLWSNWTACSVTCDTGTWHRNRTCNNPSPSNGGKNCTGSENVVDGCKIQDCPAVDGGWSLWSNWTACSVTCGSGTRHRNRTCNNPSPSNGGKNCTGSENFVDACKIQDCPAVDGGWSLWSNWTACSVTCGSGTWHRNRTCNNPSPSNGGKNCTGSVNFVDGCKIQDCPVDGGWSAWSNFTKCSVTCGTGTRKRSRQCNNPIPSNGGKNCTGSSSSSIVCKPNCPVHDPCLNHTVVLEHHRSTQFIPDINDPLICDRTLKSGWYAFDGTDELSNICVQPYHCGTHVPLWMNGSFPLVADGIVQRKVCANFGRSTAGCCDFSSSIAVKNCGTFYVYLLHPTPGCTMAYCAGNKPICKNGYIGDGSNCIDLYPKMLSPPVLGHPEIAQNNIVRFPCTVKYPADRKDAVFDVTWTVDGRPLVDTTTQQLLKTTLTGNARTAYLLVDKLQGHLGKTVSSSNLLVDEKGEEKELIIASTLPFTCDPLDQSKCRMQVSIQQQTDHNDISWSSCVTFLTNDSHSLYPKATVKVKATRDFINDHDKTQQIYLNIDQDFSNLNPVWKGYRVNRIQIRTKDRATASCTLAGDPHLSGFVHKRNYNVYDVGDFLLYGTKHNSRPFEVQIRNWGCGKFNPCTCAVVAREGNDVIEIDMCPSSLNEMGVPVAKKLSSGPLDGTSVLRDTTGKRFYINFPSGARIEVAAYVTDKNGHLTVHVQAPEDDIDQTEGICGAWFNTTDPNDGLQGKDGVTYSNNQVGNFVSTWKLSSGTSLFETVPKPDPTLSLGHQYCSCSDKVVDCTKGKGANNPNKKICNGGKCIQAKLIQKTSKRSYTADYEDEHFPETLRLKKNVRRDANFPTPNGITEATARFMCTSALQKSSIYHLCQHMPNIHTDSFIEACIEDIKYSDGNLFTVSHVNAFDMVCQTEVMKNPSRVGANGEPVPPPEITAGRCPNQCSLQGTCASGVCHCNHGYTSVDCSVKIGAPPIIHRLRGRGLCDIRSQPCVTVNVIAENLMNSDDLMCKIVYLDNNGDPHHDFVVKGEYLSFLEVMCIIPSNTVIEGTAPVQKLQISVTNDNYLYSTPRNLTIYDSKCYQCINNGSCSKKSDSCLINGHCFRDGEQDLMGNVCSPFQNQNSWVTVPYVTEIDHYTSSFTGCQCVFNPSLFDCACCKNGGCPCGLAQTNQCTSCQQMNLCGKLPHLFPPMRNK